MQITTEQDLNPIAKKLAELYTETVQTEGGDHPIFVHTGTFNGQAGYDLRGEDADNDILHLLVSEEPHGNNFLNRCVPNDLGSVLVQSHPYIFQTGDIITESEVPIADVPIERSICLTAVGEGKGQFELNVTDRIAEPVNNVVQYEAVDVLNVIGEAVTMTPDVPNYVKIGMYYVEINANAVTIAVCSSAGCYDDTTFWDELWKFLFGQGSGTDGYSAQQSDSTQVQQTGNTEWDIIVSMTNTTTSMHPNVTVSVDKPSNRMASQFDRASVDSIKAPTMDLQDVTSMIIEDRNVEEGGTYSYILGFVTTDGEAALVPLGDFVIPDVTAPYIILSGDIDITLPFNTAYIEPGYNATDNVDGTITSNVVVTGAVDITKAGTYHIYYNVADNAGNSAIQQNRTVTVAPNNAPVSNAGMDQTIKLGEVTTLNASASTDPDGNTLSYVWEQTGGTTVTLSDHTIPNPTFTAPSVGHLSFLLTVSDGYDTDTDTVTITIIGAPTANAGRDQTVHRLQNVTLDGSASSDPDGDVITHQWNQTAGPAIILSNNTAISPTFTSPDSVDAITFELTASDGKYSDTDMVTITVVNRPPWADAGPDLTVQSGEHITLSGAASTDADGDKLTYSWSVVTGQGVELTGHNDTQVSFVAPTGPTILGVLLTVSDGWHSSQDVVVIDVLKPPNRPPVSDAGTDQTIGHGKTVTLDGSSSTDPDNDDISYLWNQTHGVRVTLSDDAVSSPTFTSPNSADTLQFDLIVSDGTLHSTDTVAISVVNNPPVSDAGTDRTVGYGKTVTLDGSSSDPDNDTLHHTWQQLSGPAVSIHDSMTLSPSFVTPTSASTLTFEITTSDGHDTVTDTVTISVINNPPVSDAGADQTVQLGSTVTLDGSSSTDPDGDAISYTWNQTAGTIVTLSDDTISNPTFTAPDGAGTWTFELTISDGYDTSTDTVTITVLNRPPVSDAGADLTVRFGDTVTLNGSASTDPDQDDISYVWKEMTGIGVKLSDTTTQSPTFTAPNSEITVTFELTASDGVLSDTDTVTITVKHPNRAPAANAGTDQTAKVGDKITLSGAASTDPDGDALTYEWSVIIGPANILSNASGSSVTVTIPKGEPILGIYLIVSDGEFTSQDLVVITVR